VVGACVVVVVGGADAFEHPASASTVTSNNKKPLWRAIAATTLQEQPYASGCDGGCGNYSPAV